MEELTEERCMHASLPLEFIYEIIVDEPNINRRGYACRLCVAEYVFLMTRFGCLRVERCHPFTPEIYPKAPLRKISINHPVIRGETEPIIGGVPGLWPLEPFEKRVLLVGLGIVLFILLIVFLNGDLF